MPDKTEIINVALRRIGAESITDIADGSPNANKVADVYDAVLRPLLRDHPWNFATKRQKLARMSETPAFGYSYAYALPADWIRNNTVHDNSSGRGTIAHSTEQIGGKGAILADAEDVYLRYISLETNPNLMVADFRAVFEIALAEVLSFPIATSSSIQNIMEAKYFRQLASAKAIDAMDSTPLPRPAGSWAASRRGSRR